MGNVNNMKKISLFKKKNTENGFTLIELLVSTSIFAIVAIGAISILLGSQAAYKRISNNRMAIDNINLVLNSMTREIKFGTSYGCINTSGNFFSSSNYPSFSSSDTFGDSIGNNCNALIFTPQGATSTKIVYYLNTDKASVNEVEYNLSAGAYVNMGDFSITSSDLNINNFWFDIIGSQSNDYLQPSVKIFVSSIVSLTKNSQGVVSTTTLIGQARVSQSTLDN